MKPIPGAAPGTDGNPLVYRNPPNYQFFPTYDWDSDVTFDVYWLVFPTFAVLAANVPNQQQVQIPNEADFEVRWITYHIDTAAAQLTLATSIVPNMTLQLFAQGTSRALMNLPAPLASIASHETAQPRPLPWPMYLQRNDSITAVVTSFDAAVVTNNIRLTFAGRKIFPRSGR